jgi:hypothetical protein
LSGGFAPIQALSGQDHSGLYAMLAMTTAQR